MRLVAATGNVHKLREIREILSDCEIVSAADVGFTEEVEETGKTFLENACLKATAVANAVGMPAIADDSGLCVEALGGAPGVYSARYSKLFAPRDWTGGNKAFLLKNLEGVKDRRAYFQCAIVLAYPDGRTLTAEGRTYGTILEAPRGTSGFGYDPLFLSDDLRKSFAEATEEEKNSVSHRARALAALKELL